MLYSRPFGASNDVGLNEKSRISTSTRRNDDGTSVGVFLAPPSPPHALTIANAMTSADTMGKRVGEIRVTSSRSMREHRSTAGGFGPIVSPKAQRRTRRSSARAPGGEVA